MSNSIEKFLYNRREAAHSLGMSIRSLDYLIARRDLDTRHVGGKRLVTRESLRRFACGNHPEPIRPKVEPVEVPVTTNQVSPELGVRDESTTPRDI